MFQEAKYHGAGSGVTLKDDGERVRLVRDAMGDDIALMIDANNAWDAHTAIWFGRMIEEYDDLIAKTGETF